MKKEMVVGAVFMLALCLTAFGTIAVSGLDLFSAKVTWEVDMTHLSGLQAGDDVRVLGYRMGVVRKIKFNRERAVFKLKLVMDAETPLYTGYKITVRDSSALGGKYLSVDPGKPGTGLPDVGNLTGERAPVDIMGGIADIIGELKEAVKAVTESKGTLGKIVMQDDLYDDIKEMSASLKTISARIEKGQGTIGRLINEDEVYVQLREVAEKLNSGNGALAKLMKDESGVIIDDLRSAAASIKSIAAKIDEGGGTIGKLVNDGKLYDNANLALGKASDIMQGASEGKGTIGKLLTDDELYNNANAFARNASEATARVVDGKGTIGKLVNDPELYENVKKLLARAIDTIENARDSAPVSAVTSFIFGPFQ